MIKKILVTGGLGYIGSHTCIELLKNNYKVTILDSLFNSKFETFQKNLFPPTQPDLI